MFTPSSLRFLRQLRRNNNRDWFTARKPDFEDLLLQPMKDFVEEVDVALAKFAPEITGSPRKSIFRIYRDVRFSKDKSPYKTNMGCWFTHVRAGHGTGSETHGAGAGFYFHLEPGKAFAAAGIWMPPRTALNRIRAAIADAPHDLPGLLSKRSLKSRFTGLSDESRLKRVPRPWAPDHPAAELLRYGSFTVSAPLTDAQVTGPALVKQVTRDFRLVVPFVRWLNSALGYPPMERR
ncbi:MAG: DUF2461 domain-containing protein [Gemmatimonadota bacterium]